MRHDAPRFNTLREEILDRCVARYMRRKQYWQDQAYLPLAAFLAGAAYQVG